MNVACPERHVHRHTDEGGSNSSHRSDINNNILEWEITPAMPSYEEGYQEAMIRLQMKDDKGIPLPDIAVTASTALNAGRPPAVSDRKPSSKQDNEDTFCPIINLTAKLERISTGDEIAPCTGHVSVPLNEGFRNSSRNGAHFGPRLSEPANLRPAGSSVFSDTTSINSMSSLFTDDASYATAAAAAAHLTLSTITLNHIDGFEGYQTPIGSPDHQSLSAPPPPLLVSSLSADSLASPGSTTFTVPSSSAMPVPPPPPPLIQRSLSAYSLVPPGSATLTSSSSSTASKKKKNRKRPKRVLDKTRVALPTDNDVLFGRGPRINKNPGNIKFRKKALNYRAWYKRSSKETKKEIASLLVQSVMDEGYRFLEKDERKLWREVIKGDHTKASQTFRDLHKTLALSPSSVLRADVPLAFDKDELLTLPPPSIPRSDVYRSFDENALLNEDHMRISSGQWVKDDEPGTVDLGTIDPSLFFGETNHAIPKA